MSVENLPFVSVQPDWEEVVEEVAAKTTLDSSFWIACYLTGKNSVQGSVKVKLNQENEIELEGRNGITVTSLNARTFQVECTELDIKNVTIFSPKASFSPVKNKSVTCLDVSPNGHLFAAGNGSEVSVGNSSDGEVHMTLKGHLSDVTTVQFFPSNLVILTGGADFQLKIWSVLNGSNPVTLQGHKSAITSTAIISQGRNVLSSSRDGTVKLWNCGTSSTISTMGDYSFPVNKMILAKLPSQYEPASVETLDPLEVDTADKLVLVALGDGSLRGIHLGTKKEIFATPTTSSALTAIAYEQETGTIFTGNENGLVQVFCTDKSFEVPHIAWKRSGHAITSLVTKLSENGETVLCVSTADGTVYQTGSLASFIGDNKTVRVEAEYTGNELEPVYEMKVLHSLQESGSQRIACGVRDGKIKIY